MTRLRAFSQSLPMALLRAREAVMERFRPILRRHRVTEQQWRVLRALSSVEHVTARELSDLTYLSAPSLSRILRTLERRSLVLRRGDKADRRTTLVSLASKGAQLLSRVGSQSEDCYGAIARDFGSAALRDLHARLEALHARLGDAAASTRVTPARVGSRRAGHRRP